jgi:hypothetical protein
MVARLRDIHHMYVWAFGDSVLDLQMLRKADQAIVVVGEEQNRSKTMDAALLNAIDNGGLSAQQALLILLSAAAVSILSKYSMQQTETPPSCS